MAAGLWVFWDLRSVLVVPQLSQVSEFSWAWAPDPSPCGAGASLRLKPQNFEYR